MNVQLLFYGVVFPAFVQNYMKHSRVVLFNFSSMRFVSALMVLPYSSTDTTIARKNSNVISSVRSDFHMTDNLLIAVHAFAIRMLISLSINMILLPLYVD